MAPAVSVKSILTFFLLACALSFGLSRLPALPLYHVNLTDVLCGFGPLLSGWLCFRLFGTPRPATVLGPRPGRALLLALGTVVTFVVSHRAGGPAAAALTVTTQLLYCLGEEYGWRGYLQSATAALPKWPQALLIGGLWFGWHFAWLSQPLQALLGQGFQAPPAAGVAIGIALLTLFSLLLGWCVQRTHTILLPALLHLAVKTDSVTLLVTLALVVLATVTWKPAAEAAPTSGAAPPLDVA